MALQVSDGLLGALPAVMARLRALFDLDADPLAIGAVLLDKEDPAKVLGRTVRPLISAADQDREGYVPNVVYTWPEIASTGARSSRAS